MWGILIFVFNSIYLDALQQIVLNSEFWCVALDLSALHPWCLLLQLLGCNVFKCTECNCIALHPLCFLQCTMYLYMMHCIASAMHPRCLLLQLLGCGAALYFLHATCHGHHPPTLRHCRKAHFFISHFYATATVNHPKTSKENIWHLHKNCTYKDKVNSAKLKGVPWARKGSSGYF